MVSFLDVTLHFLISNIDYRKGTIRMCRAWICPWFCCDWTWRDLGWKPRVDCSYVNVYLVTLTLSSESKWWPAGDCIAFEGWNPDDLLTFIAEFPTVTLYLCMPLLPGCTSNQPALRVQLIQIDHFLTQPGPLDNSSLPRVPVIRIYGPSSLGKKACLHVHQVYPYFYIEYHGDLNTHYG